MNIPDKNIMSFSAKDLKENTPEVGYLRGEVRRHIRLIELEIRDAVKAKKCAITHEIEQNFTVQLVSNRDAQRFVYSAIIDQLCTNGFVCRLILTKKICSFSITWVTATDRDEVARQEKLISDARD